MSKSKGSFDRYESQIAGMVLAPVTDEGDAEDEDVTDDEETKALAVKAAPDDDLPSPDDLLGIALENLELTAAYADESITPEQRLELLHALRIVCRAWMREAAEEMMAVLAPAEDQEPKEFPETKAFTGDAARAVKAFFGKSKKFIRNMLTAGALAVFGPEELTPAMIEGVDENVAVQVAFLDGFEAKLRDGTKPLDGTVAANAELFGGAVWPSSHDLIRKVAKKSTFIDEEMRKHVGQDDPCRTCSVEQSKGWVKLGSLLSIGLSPCMNACHCHFVYRHSNNKSIEYIAGRGPIFEGAFGATG